MSVMLPGEWVGAEVDARAVTGLGSANGQLRGEEIAIARRFRVAGGWPYALAMLGGTGLWASSLVLALAGWMPLMAAFVVSTVFCSCSYLFAHESIHHNVFPRGSRWHWLNELCGWVALLPMALPFSLARVVHVRHHAHVNDPDADPDFIDDAPTLRTAVWRSIVNRQPVGGWRESYRRACEQVGTRKAAAAARHAIALGWLYVAALMIMAWSGHALVAALVWWLPRHIGLTYGRIYLSWMPHHPRQGRQGRQERYRSTRVFHSALGDLGSSYMGYHLYHHLYPTIPLHLTKPAYHALRPILVARGVDCSAKPARGTGMDQCS